MKTKLEDTRKFTFSDKVFIIKEILEHINFKMNWTWNTGCCSFCKNKLEKTITHIFYRIEILICSDVDETKATLNNIIIIGNTIDNRLMQIKEEKYIKEILSLSNKFKYLIGE